MATDYALVIKSRAGVAQYILTGDTDGFRWLSYRKEVNAPGLLMFDLDADHAAVTDLERDGQVEVWRQDTSNGVAWYADFGALFVDEERSADDDGVSTFRALCPGYLDFLNRAIIAWKADTSSRSIFTTAKAETIMKTLVTYNATSSATVGNGRERTTDLTNISVASDAAGGNTITFACAWQTLLDALQEVAHIGDRDFWLERTGAQAWEFRTSQYYGTDRSTTVVFALNYGNMSKPQLRRNRISEKTVTIVGGQGEEASRTVVVRTGTNYNSTYNSKEIFYPATEYSTTAGLQAAGDVRLEELEARDELTWEAIQTPGSRYGVHYGVGDLVTGYYQGISATKQIVAAVISFAPSSDRAENIQVETANP